MVEREKKYLVSENDAEKLKKRALYKLLVIQWYISDTKEGTLRIRYTFDGKEEKWVLAKKGKIKSDFTRTEEERELSKKEVERYFGILKDAPVVAKTRYYLSFAPVEVVLDEFLDVGKSYNVDIKYLAEIETDQDFEKIEKEYPEFVEIPIDQYETYENRNIAVSGGRMWERMGADGKLWERMGVNGKKWE